MRRLILLLAAIFPVICSAQLFGEYQFNFTSSFPLWDLSGTYVTTDGGLERTSNLNVSPAGVVTGTGTLQYDDSGISLVATQASSGRVTANAKLGVRILVNGKGHFDVNSDGLELSGPFKGSLKATLNPIERTLNGTLSGTFCIPKQGCQTISTNTTLQLPAGMDGSWSLTLDVQTIGNSVIGTAIVLLSNGRELPFDVTGSYSATKSLSKLKLKGTGTAARTALSVAIDNTGQFVSLKGKLLGQPLVFQ